MIIDMNYWGKVLKNLLILALSILGFYLGFKLDYLIFVKTFFINLLYYFFVWQTSENDIFFKKMYLFHFFYDKIQL